MIFSQSPKLMKIRKITDIVRLQRAIAFLERRKRAIALIKQEVKFPRADRPDQNAIAFRIEYC
jgi:hypothetical protein